MSGIPFCCRVTLQSFALACLIAGAPALYAGSVVPAGAPEAAGTVDFESYPAGDVNGVSGWKVQLGKAAVVESDAASGVRSLALLPGVAEAEVIAPWNLVNKLSASVALRLKGVPAVDSPESREFVNAAGALIAVVREDDTTGRLWVLDGAGGFWRPSALTVALDSSGRVAGWKRLVLNLDFASGLWNLSDGAGTVESGIGLAQDAGLGSVVRFYGYAGTTWYADDLQVDFVANNEGTGGGGASGNAATGSGASGSSGTGSGTAGSASSTGGASGTTGTAGKTILIPAKKLSKLVFVNGKTGNDANDGSKEHPVATLRAGFALLDPVKAEIHVTEGTYHLPSRKFPGVRFVSEGRVVIK